MSQIDVSKLNLYVRYGNADLSVSKLNMYARLIPGSQDEEENTARQGHIWAQKITRP